MPHYGRYSLWSVACTGRLVMIIFVYCSSMKPSLPVLSSPYLVFLPDRCNWWDLAALHRDKRLVGREREGERGPGKSWGLSEWWSSRFGHLTSQPVTWWSSENITQHTGREENMRIVGKTGNILNCQKCSSTIFHFFQWSDWIILDHHRWEWYFIIQLK